MISPRLRSKSTPRKAWTPPKCLTTPRMTSSACLRRRADHGLPQEARSLSAASRRTVRRAPSGAAIRSIKRNAALPADLLAGLRDERETRLETIGPLEVVEAGD